MAAVDNRIFPVANTFEANRRDFVVTVKIPKYGGNKPTSQPPLNATAPAFEPDTTTAPQLPPGLTPRNSTFDKTTDDTTDIDTNKYISAIASVKKNVPNKCAVKPTGGIGTEVTTSGTANSPASSGLTTVVSQRPVNVDDAMQLEKLLGGPLASKIFMQFDPATDINPDCPAIRTFPLFDSGRRYEIHTLIERIWANRLDHRTDRRTQCMYIGPAGSYVPKWKRPQDYEASKKTDRNDKIRQQTIIRQPPPPRLVHAAWDLFAVREDSTSVLARAQTAEEYAAGRKKFDEVLQEGEKLSKHAPQTRFKQTFKQTSRDETKNGKLGGPRKYLNVEHTEHHADDLLKTIATEEAADVDIFVLARTKLSPHLHDKPSVVPPHLRGKTAEAITSTANTIIANGVIPEGTTNTNKADNCSDNVWVAAKLPMLFG